MLQSAATLLFSIGDKTHSVAQARTNLGCVGTLLASRPIQLFRGRDHLPGVY